MSEWRVYRIFNELPLIEERKKQSALQNLQSRYPMAKLRPRRIAPGLYEVKLRVAAERTETFYIGTIEMLRKAGFGSLRVRDEEEPLAPLVEGICYGTRHAFVSDGDGPCQCGRHASLNAMHAKFFEDEDASRSSASGGVA